MKTIYTYSIGVARDEGAGLHFVHRAGVISVPVTDDSKQVATTKVAQMARDGYPAEDGWRAHSVSIEYVFEHFFIDAGWVKRDTEEGS